jgi:hypothetical protein
VAVVVVIFCSREAPQPSRAFAIMHTTPAAVATAAANSRAQIRLAIDHASPRWACQPPAIVLCRPPDNSKSIVVGHWPASAVRADDDNAPLEGVEQAWPRII